MAEDNGANCRLEYDDEGVAWLYLDCANASTNTMPMRVLRDLTQAVEELEGREELKGLVILSAKQAGFVAGASNDELELMDDVGHVDSLMQWGHSVMGRIASLPVPTVALIHGHCLGSGLELALACRYRVAESGANAALGLPDVRLGLHPCHGATARLPVLIGAWQALNLLTTGSSVDSTRALKLGLVDRVAAIDQLRDAARDLLRLDPGRHYPGGWTRSLLWAPMRWLIYQIRDGQMRRGEASIDNFPATYAMLRLWRDHGGANLTRRLKAERESLLRLISEPGALNLVRTYLLQDRLRRDARAQPVPFPAHVYVFGAGEIGAGVAAVLALHGREVTLVDPDEKALQRASRRAESLWRQRLGENGALEAARARLIITTEAEGLSDAEFVVEAIHEDLPAKKTLYAGLEEHVPEHAVIASTTSTLLIEELAEDMARPEGLIGMHFFRPVERMPVVEIVAGAASADRAVATGQVVGLAMDKLPLPVRSKPGFLVNRLQLPYMLKGAEIYERARREIIDTAALRFGMPIGPLEMADSVGLDVCLDLAERLGYPVPKQLRERVEAGQLGLSSGQGFHDWKRARRVTASVPPGNHAMQGIARHLVEPMVREAQRCVDEGVVADADLVDVGALFGAGFPAYTGGPLTLKREKGWG